MVARGLEQRVRAINMFLAIYNGKQEILRAGIGPEELIFHQSLLSLGDEGFEGAA